MCLLVLMHVEIHLGFFDFLTLALIIFVTSEASLIELWKDANISRFFHQLGPLGRVGLRVAMSVCVCLCLSVCHSVCAIECSFF